MYLLGSHVSETETPNITAQILKTLEELEATNVLEALLGKKKLAYPIKKTRNGYYVVVNFTMDPKNVHAFDAKIRSLDSSIIRYLIVNLEEHLERASKDKIEQSKITRRLPVEKITEKPKPESFKTPQIKFEDIDEKTLDEKIEKALSEDLTK